MHGAETQNKKVHYMKLALLIVVHNSNQTCMLAYSLSHTNHNLPKYLSLLLLRFHALPQRGQEDAKKIMHAKAAVHVAVDLVTLMHYNTIQ